MNKLALTSAELAPAGACAKEERTHEFESDAKHWLREAVACRPSTPDPAGSPVELDLQLAAAKTTWQRPKKSIRHSSGAGTVSSGEDTGVCTATAGGFAESMNETSGMK